MYMLSAKHGLHYLCAIQGLHKLRVCGQSFFMPRGMCQLMTNDRSILVDEATFDDFITHNFVEKRKNGSNVITRTIGAEITAYLSRLKSMENTHFKFWVKSHCFKVMDCCNQTVVRLIQGLHTSILHAFRTGQTMD